MLISDLFNRLQEANPHQFEDDMLLMWLGEAETDINEYLVSNYGEQADDFEDLTLADDTQLEEPSIYIEWLSHKIDFANGEYERANNHKNYRYLITSSCQFLN